MLVAINRLCVGAPSFLAAILAVVSAKAESGAIATTLTASADTFLRSGARNQNEGTNAILRVKEGGNNRALVRFDAAEIAALGPGPVDRAVLELHIAKNHDNWGPDGRMVNAHRVTADWSELGATWSCPIDYDPSNQQPNCSTQWDGGTFVPAATDGVLHTRGLAGWIQFDVTADVNEVLAGALHRGWLLKKGDERKAGLVKYTSREGPQGFRPRLLVAARGAPPTAATTSLFSTVTATPTPTATVSASVTETPALTPPETLAATVIRSPSATETPIAPGGVIGSVFDDGASLPLAGVSVVVVGENSVTSDAHGRYAVSAGEGEQVIELSKAGYTRSLRRAMVASRTANRVRDARLTQLAPAAVVGGTGATVTSSHAGPAGTANVELAVPGGTLADGSEVRLTALGPQGLIAPLPLGWSVLLGIDIEISPPPDPALLSAGWAMLRVPLSRVFPSASLPITAAVWDETTLTWTAGPALQASAEDVELSLPAPASGPTAAAIQVALLVADTLPSAPPTPVEGARLGAVEPALLVNPSAIALADPEVILSDVSARAFAFTEVFSDAVVPSGTLLEVRLDERYDLRNGDFVAGVSSRQDVSAYQVSPRTDAGSQPFLGAYLQVAPSLPIPIAELAEGRIEVTVGFPDAAEDPALINAAGGDVTGPNGLRIIVPPGAVTGPIVLGLSSVGAASLPVAAAFASRVVGAFFLDFTGDSLDPSGPYEIDLGAPVADGARFVIGRVEVVGGRRILRAVGFGAGSGGRVVFGPCVPAAPSLCLAGLTVPGSYAVIALPASIAIVTGLVTDGVGLRPGIAVEADTAALVSVSDANGVYVLPVPADEVSTLRARDTAADLFGSVDVGPPLPAATISTDITLLSTPPRVIQLDPPNHASGVSSYAVVTVAFSEPILGSSLTPGAVELTKIDDGTTTAVAGRVSLAAGGTRLVFTPASPLEADTLYAFALSAAITDVAGAALFPFGSTFTTAALLSADALPPNTLGVSLPVDEEGEVVSFGESGSVFVCGGAQLALPGTTVVFENEATGQTTSVEATTVAGTSSSTVCDVLFPGRCDTSAPGSFCAILDGLLGERMLVHVEDAFGNVVTLDAGNMRDERTGAEVIGPEGGTVTFPGDERYQAFVPEGAFEEPTIVTITPIGDEDVGIDLRSYPALTDPDPGALRFVGAVLLEFSGSVSTQVDVSVPAPPDAAEGDQYIATRLINFRGQEVLTMVDTVFLDAERGLVVTDPSAFPGLTVGGVFGLYRAEECLGYVTGFASIGDFFARGYLPGGVLGALLPLSIDRSEPTRFAVPLPCNRPIDVSLLSLDDEIIDAVPFAVPDRGLFAELPRALTDDRKPPEVAGASVAEDATGVDPLTRLEVVLDEPVDPESVDQDTILVTDSRGRRVEGRILLSEDGRVLAFVPDSRLHYAEQYALTLEGIVDRGGQPLSGTFVRRFSTYAPEILLHVPDIDAADVVTIDPVAVGLPPARRLVAVAEGDAFRLDSQGGIVVLDVTDLSQPPPIVAEARTAGVDRALAFVAGGPITTTGASGRTFDGPFVMSVDGPGGRDRFGVWRLFDLSAFPTVTPAAGRLINHSGDSWDAFNLDAPSTGTIPPAFLKFVPNDSGVPLDVAAIGTQASYVANTPNIGLQAILPQGMDSDFAVGPQVDGTMVGLFRAVATLRNRVLAARQEGADNQLVLVDASLASVTDVFRLPAGGRPLSVSGLQDWPTRIESAGSEQDPSSEIEGRDLAVVMSDAGGMCIVPVDATAGTFEPSLLPKGVGLLRTTAGPRGGAASPDTRLFYVADGTAGLSIVDFADPSGSLDRDGDGVDDRVLATVDLGGGLSRQVAFHHDAAGRPIAVVAAGASGLFFVQVGPATAGLTLFDTNNTEIVPEEFEENDGTFVLVNDDNDDGDFDENGEPRLDLDQAGPVTGENDLRRIDIAAPMNDGTLVLEIETGAERAALWVGPEKEGRLTSPASFDLGTGERPPATLWLEALEVSRHDRDIVVLFRWTPPPGANLPDMEDRVSLTALDVNFVDGSRGVPPQGTAAVDWLDWLRPRVAFAETSAEGEKLLFPQTEAETLEEVLRGERGFDDLPNGQFGRVEIAGVEPDAITRVSVHSARGERPDTAPLSDATLGAGPTAFTMLPSGARQLRSEEDALLYEGAPLGLQPEALRATTAAADVLPIRMGGKTISETWAGVMVELQTARSHPPLRRDPAVPAVLQVVDAQEFAAEMVAFQEGEIGADELRRIYAEGVVVRDDVAGALADGVSRLVLRFELPREDPRTRMLFRVSVDQSQEPARVGNHFGPDEAFPFGSLTPTGFEVDRALELPSDVIVAPSGRHVFVAVYTPPSSFPFVDKPEGAARTLPLRFSVRAEGEAAPLAESPGVLLVRPPVMLVHGLFGDAGEDTWTAEFKAHFAPSRFDLGIVNYEHRNVSGYDVIWREVWRQFQQSIAEYRNGIALRDKRIAATKLDAVAHSMGGVAVRWLATDEFVAAPGPRLIHDELGTAAGLNFPRLTTLRRPEERYLRIGNFNAGDVRSLVAIGSPFGGSPAANWLLREAMEMDRFRFAVSAGPLSPVVSIVQSIVRDQSGKKALPENDVGTAIIDLAIGSTASATLGSALPGPMRVHAIASHGNGFSSSTLIKQFASLAGDLDDYCPGFGRNTSDLIVPDGSAFYGTDAVGQSLFEGYDHEEQSKKKEVAKRIAWQLLYDHAQLVPGERSVNSFDSEFVVGEEVPFRCM